MNNPLNPPDVLRVQISKTADGQFDYLQILSGDNFSLNIVLIGKTIQVTDQRTPKNSQERVING